MKWVEQDDAVPFGPPRNWDPRVDGTCGTLPVRIEEHGRNKYYVSRWKPDAAELARLNAGGFIELSCVGLQPPVSLNVPPVVATTEPTDEDRRRWANDMRDGM